MALAGGSLRAAAATGSPGFCISASVEPPPSTSASCSWTATAYCWHFPASSSSLDPRRSRRRSSVSGGNRGRGRLRFERNRQEVVLLWKERNFRDRCCGGGFRVRARAEVGKEKERNRADEQAEDQGTGTGKPGAAAEDEDEDEGEGEEGGGGRRRRRAVWSGEQDNEKAKVLWESTIYPIMRVYRDDLCTLELTGDARSRQAIEAMGADGGFTSAEELSKGRPLMTVETIIPGRSQDHSTVSTKLLAPTHLVHRTARENWAHKKVTLSSGNALARAFQRVVMQHVLAFDLHVHRPGVMRDMANLANEKEDAVVASLESRDAEVLDGLAEAVCLYSLANVTDDFYQKMSENRKPKKGFLFGRKPEWIWTLNRAIGIRPLSEGEILEHIKRVSEKSSDAREVKRTTHETWWPSVASFPSSHGSGEGLGRWSFDFVPIHKLQIDTRKIKAIAKGWQATKTKQVLELELTHSQMIGLADMLDLYYEDAYTGPAKRLRSGVHLKVSHHSQSKVTKMLWTALVSCVAGGVLLVALLVVSRLRRSSVSAFALSSTSSASSSPSSKLDISFTNRWCRVRTDRQPRMPANEKIPPEEMEVLCLQVVNSVKEAFSLPGEVESSPEKGAWIGPKLSQSEHGLVTTRSAAAAAAKITVENAEGNGLQDGRVGGEDIDFDDEHQTVEDVDLKNAPAASQSNSDSNPLLLYQVVLSRNGDILGFQPANKPAITRWVLFPFARALHKGRRLGSGLVERALRYSELSEEAVVIELICNLDLSPPAITARPLELQ